MRVRTCLLGFVFFVYCISACLLAVSPVAEEFAERDAWVAAKFQDSPKEAPPEAGLVILANHDPVQKNQHTGKPLKIKDQAFEYGLFCHAPSRIIVRLPSAGKTFRAMSGVDSNHAGAGGQGSVTFLVSVQGEKVFGSEVMREGMPAVPVVVDLKGAKEFTIEVTDAGDGNPFDQSCWADARVTLASGKEIRLDEMSIVEGQEKGYSSDPFLSFVYGGKSSAEFLEEWKRERSSRVLDANRTEYTLTYTDPKTKLAVRCVGVVWKDYPTVEWTVYFKNEGTADTPILESIQALDTTFERRSTGEFLLHHHKGDMCTIDSFEPLQTILKPNETKKFVPAGGRPSNFEWPYYNLECPQQGEGIIIVIGWPGQWASQFIRDAGSGLRVVGGQELTHLKLHPGEEIRTPLILLQFYQGDWIRAQNIWRRFMFAHNFPKDHGKPWTAKASAGSVQFCGFNCNQATDIEFINRFFEVGMPLDCWWMDAGWYVHDGVGWPKVGTWEVDRQRFPGGIRTIADLCHSKGMELIVWFEVERVHPDTWLTKNHPEWIFGGAGGGLLKMNEPEAAAWITNHIDKMITDEGIDLYRSDFNIDPLGYWRGNDAEDRQGITEIRYIEGYLAYWDELQRRHPGMPIDSCASGGRRDDLETMRRAIPILRTDFERSPEGNQCCTYGFALWLPYFCGPNWDNVKYPFRSTIAPFLQRNWDVRSADFNLEQGRQFLQQWRAVVDYYFGDFYPLTKYSIDNDNWMAWQFHRPDLEAGVIQAFRRPDCPFVTAQHKLRALEPEARYVVTDLDTEQPVEMIGRELMEQGVLVNISEKPGAALIVYKKVNQ